MDQGTTPVSSRVTLAEWAERHGRTVGTAWSHWTSRPDFPRPVGRRPRPGGAPGTAIAEYDEAELDAWLAAQPGMGPPPPVAFDGDIEELLTLSAFAARAQAAGKTLERSTIYQYRDREDFPKPVNGRFYRAGDVLEFMNSRPGPGNRLRGSARRRRA